MLKFNTPSDRFLKTCLGIAFFCAKKNPLRFGEEGPNIKKLKKTKSKKTNRQTNQTKLINFGVKLLYFLYLGILICYFKTLKLQI